MYTYVVNTLLELHKTLGTWSVNMIKRTICPFTKSKVHHSELTMLVMLGLRL